MADLSFLETDSNRIYDCVITSLEEFVGEPLYPGDERRIFGDSLVALFVAIYNEANSACKQKMLQYASGEVLDAIGARYKCIRIAPTKAKTTLQFSVKTPLNGNILISAGTKVTPDNEIYFETTESVVLQAGKTSVTVDAIACETGASYNGYGAGMLNQLVDLVPYIDEVTNIITTYDGDDGEPYPDVDGGVGDNSYRERIYLAPTALSVAGPHDAYKYHALSADSSIADVAVISEVEQKAKTLRVYGGHAFLGGKNYLIDTLVVNELTPEDDYIVTYEDDLLVITLAGDETSRESIDITINKEMAGEVKIVPILAGGVIPDSDMLKKVKEACSALDVRPMTDLVLVEAPDQVEYDIDITYYTTEENESDCIETIEGANGSIQQFIEWQGTKLGRDINPDKLRTLCLAPSNGIGCNRIMINAPVFTKISKSQVAMYSGNLVIKHVVEDE